MKTKLLLSLVLLPLFLHGQLQKERDVIAPGGNSFDGGNLLVEYTVGELSAQTVTAGNLILTQGFIQPTVIITGIEETAKGISIQLFPNPVSHQLHVSLNSSLAGIWSCHIINVLGQVMPGSQRIGLTSQNGSAVAIDCSQYPAGVYFVRLFRNNEATPVNYKLVKIH